MGPGKYRARFNERKAEAICLLLEHFELVQQIKEENTVNKEGKMDTNDQKIANFYS